MSALKDSINRRLSLYEEQDAFLLASALDPWFKLKWCMNTEYSTIKTKLTSKVKLIAKQDAPVLINLDPQPTTESTTTSTKSFFDTLMQGHYTTTTNSSSESVESLIEEYLSMPYLQQNEDPLLLWKLNEKKFEVIIFVFVFPSLPSICICI